MRRLPWMVVCLAAWIATAGAEPPAPGPTVFFADWSGFLDDAAKAVIQRAADRARNEPRSRLTVTAYADATGSDRANLYLTQLRAQRVIDLLVADGVAAARIHAVPQGRQARQGLLERRVQIDFR